MLNIQLIICLFPIPPSWITMILFTHFGNGLLSPVDSVDLTRNICTLVRVWGWVSFRSGALGCIDDKPQTKIEASQRETYEGSDDEHLI